MKKLGYKQSEFCENANLNKNLEFQKQVNMVKFMEYVINVVTLENYNFRNTII